MRTIGIGLVAALVAFTAWVVVGLVAYALFVPAADQPVADRADPANPQLTIVAMGDSYMSGEGAGRFYRGTDRPGVDSCRRAPTAYPPRVADALRARLYFVACSGARTYNVGSRFSVPGVVPTAQYRSSPLQIETLKAHSDADVVLLSIGGNDAQFSNIVALCAGRGDSCVPKATPWMNNLDAAVQPALRDLYTEVRRTAAPATHVYVSTYPVPFPNGVRSCRSVGMDTDEVGFIRKFIARLNDQIELAARYAGVDIVDLSTTLQSRGLCADVAEATVNGWREQKPDGLPKKPIDPLRGSFHPTEYGHARMAGRILDHLRQTPAPSPAGPRQTPPNVPFDGPPGTSSDGPPDLPPTLPPYEPDEFGPPLPPFHQDRNPCTPTASRREVVDLDGATDRFKGVRPGSQVCFRTLHGEWHTTRADAQGRAIVRFQRAATAGIGGYRRVLYRSAEGEWIMRILRPGASAAPPDVSIVKAWITSREVPLLVGIGFALVVTYAAAFTLVRRVADQRG